ncbi:MAG: DMT family transporter [Leptolyngbyaceae cyanobacterium]
MINILISLGYAFCWGVGLTLTKIALSEISAPTLLVIQLLASVIFLAIICYIKNRQFPFSFQGIRQGYAGIFEPALAYMISIFGIQMTSASNATMIGASEVIITIVLAAVFLGERLSGAKLLLAGISFSGILLLLQSDILDAGNASALGNVLVLLGTVFAVLYVLVSKQQLESAEPTQLTLSQQFVGLIVSVICFAILSLISPVYEVNATGISLPFWLLAVVSGLMQYALAFLLYLIALQKVPASHAAFYIALVPIFGVISAVAIIGEQLTLVQCAGGLLIIVASYCANRLMPA